MTALPTPERALEPRLRGMAPSPSLAIQELCAKLAATGRPVFQLGLGQSPFPVPRSVVYSLRANAAEKSYLPVRGLPQLRAAVADYHRRRHGVLHTSDDVLVGPGSKELMFLLQVAFRGELMLPVPSCVSYEPQGRLVGHRVRRIPTDMAKRFLLTPDALDEACQTAPDVPRLLVLNSPSNPAGQRYTMSHLEALASVARRHGVIVLSDEIYAELDFRGAHVSIARFYDEGTIIASGLSKWCGAGGWRLGTLTFPRGLRWLLDAIASVASETYSTTSAPIQHAAVRAFCGAPDIEVYLVDSRRILEHLTEQFRRGLAEAGLDVLPPAGSFYLFPSFEPIADRLRRRGIRTAPELCSRLLEETGIASLPGSDFGLSPERLFLRLALVDFDGARALMSAFGSPLDEVFLRTYCAPTMRAMDALVEWITGL